ncbi:uncharacterized protein DEA37_0014847 [Paragonimus westermani]|uniref:Uncharacterized protein n=1 Tax=Paragonimus westermani TaxID=34504 RepID=A0A5J4NXE5_9TREM|nr:uncharacterized protein DEA37_0014847 [Paragonimus westermani]
MTDLSNRNFIQHTRHKELADRLQTWLNLTEQKVEKVNYKVVDSAEFGHSNPAKTHESRTDETVWNCYLDEYKNLVQAVELKTPEFEQLRAETSELAHTQMGKKSLELFERFSGLRTHLKQKIEWLLQVQQKIELFHQVVQEGERWLTTTHFKLVSPSAVADESPNRLSSNPSVNMSNCETLLRCIELDGGNYVQQVHELAHLLIHCALNDRPQTTIVCDSVRCDLRQVPFDQSAVNTVKQCMLLAQTNDGRNSNRPLAKIALNVVQRAHELETNYGNLCANAQAMKVSCDLVEFRFP